MSGAGVARRLRRTARLVGLALALGSAALGAPVELFVAPTGDDAGPGTAAAPFATLERARGELRQRRAAAGGLPGGATVWLHDGEYVRTATFALTAADAGAAGAPVVYAARPGAHVRLTGGRTLTGDWCQRVRDAAVLGRLLDAGTRALLMQANLRTLGVSDYGELRRRGFSHNEGPGPAPLQGYSCVRRIMESTARSSGPRCRNG